ncbi:Uncharacterized conserved protein [Neisseria animaloris]|uniref:Uncharacterized conserved protein n=1 Tax=Neisseria animaloris TaxID=326522 RepID=A0A1X3CID2_9NEIS|nr:Rossmann-like and DUF2520 domain-containing protein [Neisseria animaloris]MDO5073879.1 DUF2520 domain-containing protein [Neisseria animaloris]OSI07356.1 hypothetical protein BWD08_07340 [Neisseria animaloris]VEH87737.1 Uncharacterized conserved protein [Neisseria animaloris]VEJ22167.1 Uncharacterized conserved protein [Neisseria animaloris]
MKKTFHIIGAGRVGQTFATVLPKNGRWQLANVVSRSSTVAMADCISKAIVPRISYLPEADTVFICTPDNIIEETAAAVACLPWLNTGTLVLHMSGAKTVAVLDAAARSGAMTGSLHPVFAFADIEKSVAELAGNLCALEAGSEAAMTVLHELADAAGLRAFEIPSEHKARYHAALSAASNFSVTLAAFAQDLLHPLHLPEQLSRELVCNLMQQSVNNLARLTPLQALTGPIVRGDDSTVAAHLACMNVQEQKNYRLWAQATLELARARLSEESARQMENLLERL